CADHSAVASAVELVLNQRLVRRLCSQCSGQGCAACLLTGYRGRLPLVEWLRVNDAVRRGIIARNLGEVAAQPSLAEGAKALVQAGRTSEVEIGRVLGVAQE